MQKDSDVKLQKYCDIDEPEEPPPPSSDACVQVTDININTHFSFIKTMSLDFSPSFSTVLDSFQNCFRLIVDGSFVIIFKIRSIPLNKVTVKNK